MWQTWLDAWEILVVLTSRLALIVSVLFVESAFSWLVGRINTFLGAAGSQPASDLNLVIRLMVDALDVSLLTTIIFFAAVDTIAAAIGATRRLRRAG